MNSRPGAANFFSIPLQQMNYIRSLDGLRAISIALVLFGHSTGTIGFPPVAYKSVLGDVANLGVQVFFIISGFLITKLLLRESAITGNVNLRLFYIRRALRIAPPFLAFWCVVAMGSNAGWLRLNPFDLLYAFTYTTNYSVDPSWYVGHLWSLSIEEQFYLLWPLAVKKAGNQNCLWIALGALGLAPFVRLAAVFGGFPDLPIFPAVLDGMAIGCCLGVLQPQLHASAIYRRVFTGPMMAMLLVIVFAINRFRPYTVVMLVGTPIMLLAVALLVDWAIRTENWVTRQLNKPFVRYVGVLSYSLYLWQQLFLNRSSSQSIFPLNVVLAFLTALLFFYLVEKPTLGLRKQFSALGGPPAKALSASSSM